MTKLNFEEYLPKMEKYDMSLEKKKELFDQLELIVTHFVDMAFDPDIKLEDAFKDKNCSEK